MASSKGASTIKLRGITWGHTRGYTPLVATAQAYMDVHPDVEVVWDKRSLWEFGEGRIDDLINDFDLLVVDHPFMGYAAERELFLALDEHLPFETLAELASQSVGPSYRSYRYGDQLWALPIDAAGHVAASRPDLLPEGQLPQTWADVIDLARRTRKVAVPFAPVDVFSCFITLCANQGEVPCRDGLDVSRALGEQVLGQLRELASVVDPACLRMNPIQTFTRMTATDEIAYVPLSYGYSNYSRGGYAARRVVYHGIPGPAGGSGAILGGAGVAISSRTHERAAALDYASWVMSAECQRTTYVLSGGQPGHRAAWTDEVANRVTCDFFHRTLPTLDRAYLRPNHLGFTEFQTAASGVLHAHLQGERSPVEVLNELESLYASTRTT